MKTLSQTDRQLLSGPLESALRAVAAARLKRVRAAQRQAALSSAHVALMCALDIAGRINQVEQP